MDREETLQALDEISDKHIEETEKAPKKTKKIIFRSAIAAILAVAIGVGVILAPMPVRADAVALPGDARVMEHKRYDDFKDDAAWKAYSEAYKAENSKRSDLLKTARNDLLSFFTEGNREFLSGDGSENMLWSPVNTYIGLAMLSELTSGESKQQIMDLLGASSSTDLRDQVSAVWETIYNDSSSECSTLANSLWLQDGMSFEQETMDDLAYYYYASVYKGELGSEKINNAIGAWLNNNTGGFLKKYTGDVSIDPQTLLVLYSTISFQSKWRDEFSEKNNTQGTFHGGNGDQTVTFMNKKEAQMYYYWGEDFAAVNMDLKNGSSMWFILPDEDKTVSDVLKDGEYMSMISEGKWENSKYMKVNLSVPKFDISGQNEMNTGLKNLGVTDIFDENKSDFSAISCDQPLVAGQIKQTIRVEIDEEGVKAAAYIEIPMAGAAEPPEEVVDFILDRPFLFVIENSGIPLFTGVVNEP